MIAIEWSTSTSTVGSKKRPGVAPVAAGENARARVARLVDVPGDDVELRGERDGADVGAAGPLDAPWRRSATFS